MSGIIEIITGAMSVAGIFLVTFIFTILIFDYQASYGQRNYGGYQQVNASVIAIILFTVCLLVSVPAILQIIFGAFAIKNKNCTGCMVFGYIMGGLSAFSLLQALLAIPTVISFDSATVLIVLFAFFVDILECCLHFLFGSCAQWQRKMNNYNKLIENNGQQNNKEYLNINKYNYGQTQQYNQYPPYPPYPQHPQNQAQPQYYQQQYQQYQAPGQQAPQQYNPYYGYPDQTPKEQSDNPGNSQTNNT